jgi:hypothetical protein
VKGPICITLKSAPKLSEHEAKPSIKGVRNDVVRTLRLPDSYAVDILVQEVFCRIYRRSSDHGKR